MGAGLPRVLVHAVVEARKRGAEVLTVRCQARAAPLDPLDQLARDLTRISGRVGPEPESLARSLDALTGEGPVLVVVEDVEQCAPGTRDALGHPSAG